VGIASTTTQGSEVMCTGGFAMAHRPQILIIIPMWNCVTRKLVAPAETGLGWKISASGWMEREMKRPISFFTIGNFVLGWEMRVSALLGARKAGVKEGGADFCVDVCRSPDLTWIGIKGLLPILQDVQW
jgi:hypothetical protein